MKKPQILLALAVMSVSIFSFQLMSDPGDLEEKDKSKWKVLFNGKNLKG